MNGKLVLICLLVLSALPPVALSHIQGPPKKGEAGQKTVQIPAPDFTLVDQEGKPFSFGSLRGKVVLATFIYTTCPDVCPLLTAKFAEIQRRLKREKRDDYFLLSISTDPEVDTPKVLKSYARRFGADFRTWTFLTGDNRELSKVWDAFDVKVKKLGKGQIQHTGLTTLIDPKGIRRVNHYGDTWTEKDVLKDILKLTTGG